MKVINLTPHDVNICDENGRITKTYRASGMVARADNNYEIIDDVNGVTLVACSSTTLKLANGGNIEAAGKVGAEIAKLALAKGIEKVVFDRCGYVYHGRVAAVAEAAREAGLKF